VRLERAKTATRELRDDLAQRQSPDRVSGLFLCLRPPDPNGRRSRGRGCRLGDRDGAAGDPRHLGQAQGRILEVMQAVMDVDDVDRGISERKRFRIGHDESDI
jgi:hypothetical protein